MVQPISVIFKLFQSKSPVQIWLYDNKDARMEGIIIVCVFYFTGI